MSVKVCFWTQGDGDLTVWCTKPVSTSHVEVPRTKRYRSEAVEFDVVEFDIVKIETVNPQANNAFEVVDIILIDAL